MFDSWSDDNASEIDPDPQYEDAERAYFDDQQADLERAIADGLDSELGGEEE